MNPQTPKDEQESTTDVAGSGLTRFTQVEDTQRAHGDDNEQSELRAAHPNTPSLGDEGAGASASVPESAAAAVGQESPLDSTELLQAVAIDAPARDSASAFNSAATAETKAALETASVEQSVLVEELPAEQADGIEMVASEAPLADGGVLQPQAGKNGHAVVDDTATKSNDSTGQAAQAGAVSTVETSTDSNHLDGSASGEAGDASNALDKLAKPEFRQETFTVAADQSATIDAAEVNQAATAKVDTATKSVTPLPAAAPELAPFDPEIGQKVLDRIRISLRPGLQVATIELTPVDLGRVQIKLQMKDGGLSASFRAETAQTREILERQLPELRALLASQGIAADRIEVDFDSSTFEQANAGDAQAQERSPKRSNQARTFDISFAGADASDAPNTTNDLRSVSGIDTLA